MLFRSLESITKDQSAKLDNIQKIVLEMNSKFPTNGLSCPVHQLRMDGFEKRISKTEEEINGITKKIITWTAVAGCVLFVITNLILPYFLQNFQVVNESKAEVISVETNTAYQLWTNSFKR